MPLERTCAFLFEKINRRIEIYAVCPKCGKAFESDEVFNCFSDFFFGSASLYCVECSAQMNKQ